MEHAFFLTFPFPQGIYFKGLEYYQPLSMLCVYKLYVLNVCALKYNVIRNIGCPRSIPSIQSILYSLKVQ